MMVHMKETAKTRTGIYRGLTGAPVVGAKTARLINFPAVPLRYKAPCLSLNSLSALSLSAIRFARPVVMIRSTSFFFFLLSLDVARFCLLMSSMVCGNSE